MTELLITEFYEKLIVLLEEMSLSLEDFYYDEKKFYFTISDELDEDQTRYTFSSWIPTITFVDSNLISALVINPLFDLVVPATKLKPELAKSQENKIAIENIQKVIKEAKKATQNYIKYEPNYVDEIDSWYTHITRDTKAPKYFYQNIQPISYTQTGIYLCGSQNTGSN